MISKHRIPEKNTIEDESLIAYYSTMAKRYMRFPVRRILGRIKAFGINRGVVLDVGTGPGIFAIEIARSMPSLEVVAVDISEGMVKAAQKNAQEMAVANRIHFQVASAYSLPLKDNSVDLLLCIHTIHHLDDPLLFFNEAARVLKPQGKYVMVDLRRDAPLPIAILFNILWRLIIREEGGKNGLWDSLRSAFTKEECTKMLTSSALPPCRIYNQTIDMWMEYI